MRVETCFKNKKIYFKIDLLLFNNGVILKKNLN